LAPEVAISQLIKPSIRRKEGKMVDYRLNKVSAQGNNIFVFQYIDTKGNKTEERKSFEEFLRPFIKPYKKRIKDLKRTLKDKQKIEGHLDKEVLQLSAKIGELENQKEVREKQVAHFLKEAENEDLSDTSERYQQAFKLFANGKVAAALEVLDEAKLEANEKKLLEEVQQAAKTRMLNARILRVDNKFKKAGDNYEKALSFFKDWDSCLEVANYFKFLNEFTTARKYYLQSLEFVNTETEKAATLNNLGNLYRAQNEFEKAASSYEEALGIRRKLAEVNPQSYEPYVAGTLNNLGNLYRAQNEFEKAASSYEEALGIRRKLAEVNPQSYEPYVAGTLNNLGNLYRAQNEFEKAASSYEEALGIRRKLAEVNPQSYEPYVAGTLNNLGNLYRAQNEFEKAASSYEEALGIRRKLAEVNPQSYLPDVGMTLINMSIFYQHSKINKNLSITLVDEALSCLFPFVEIPYIQKDIATAFKVLQDWDIDVEAYLEEKRKELKDQSSN
jgi:tetratricopeptide (TPR) repeat protein